MNINFMFIMNRKNNFTSQIVIHLDRRKWDDDFNQ